MGIPSLTLQPLPHCRNKVLIDKYGDDVIAAYAQGFVKDVVMGASLRTAANHLMLAAAQAAHLAEFERVTAENARVAALHASEVKEKQFKEQQYTKVRGSSTMESLSTGQGESVPVYIPLLDFTSSGTTLPYRVAPLVPSLNLPMIYLPQALERWERTREQLVEKFKADTARAKKEHLETVTRVEKEWQTRREEVSRSGEGQSGTCAWGQSGTCAWGQSGTCAWGRASLPTLTAPSFSPLNPPLAPALLFVADRSPEHRPPERGRVLACAPAGGCEGGEPKVPRRARGQGQGQKGARKRGEGATTERCRPTSEGVTCAFGCQIRIQEGRGCAKSEHPH